MADWLITLLAVLGFAAALVALERSTRHAHKWSLLGAQPHKTPGVMVAGPQTVTLWGCRSCPDVRTQILTGTWIRADIEQPRPPASEPVATVNGKDYSTGDLATMAWDEHFRPGGKHAR
jgi:hypothetical protein